MWNMRVRGAEDTDWPAVWGFLQPIVAAGETYTWDRDVEEARARALWMLPPPALVLVAEVDGAVVGSAKITPNQAGPGSHVANGSFLVDPAWAGLGVGRALGLRALEVARGAGYRAMQFNAVVATNTRAVALWTSLGFAVVGRVPAAFAHPVHGDVDLLVLHRPL